MIRPPQPVIPALSPDLGQRMTLPTDELLSLSPTRVGGVGVMTPDGDRPTRPLSHEQMIGAVDAFCDAPFWGGRNLLVEPKRGQLLWHASRVAADPFSHEQHPDHCQVDIGAVLGTRRIDSNAAFFRFDASFFRDPDHRRILLEMVLSQLKSRLRGITELFEERLNKPTLAHRTDLVLSASDTRLLLTRLVAARLGQQSQQGSLTLAGSQIGTENRFALIESAALFAAISLAQSNDFQPINFTCRNGFDPRCGLKIRRLSTNTHTGQLTLEIIPTRISPVRVRLTPTPEGICFSYLDSTVPLTVFLSGITSLMMSQQCNRAYTSIAIFRDARIELDHSLSLPVRHFENEAVSFEEPDGAMGALLRAAFNLFDRRWSDAVAVAEMAETTNVVQLF